jgi:predicted negative regulator of RcsB-dependent stress response
MLTMLTAPAMTLLFLGVVFSLGAAFVWMFWEFEQMKQRRKRGRFGARGFHQNGPR